MKCPGKIGKCPEGHECAPCLQEEVGRLSNALAVIRDSFWSENEPLADRIVDLQEQARTVLLSSAQASGGAK